MDFLTLSWLAVTEECMMSNLWLVSSLFLDNVASMELKRESRTEGWWSSSCSSKAAKLLFDGVATGCKPATSSSWIGGCESERLRPRWDFLLEVAGMVVRLWWAQGRGVKWRNNQLSKGDGCTIINIWVFNNYDHLISFDLIIWVFKWKVCANIGALSIYRILLIYDWDTTTSYHNFPPLEKC